jgi:hypothetical protein
MYEEKLKEVKIKEKKNYIKKKIKIYFLTLEKII